MKNMIYEEKLSSPKTQLLFVILSIIFGFLTAWHAKGISFDGLAIITLVLAVFFLFYIFNYKTLIIRITNKKLKLKFGIFSWTVPFANIESCELDNNLPLLMKYGGAGIHFMMAHGRYRVSFNFLEYDRVTIRMKQKKGWVQDVSFSTEHPMEIINILQKSLHSRV